MSDTSWRGSLADSGGIAENDQVCSELVELRFYHRRSSAVQSVLDALATELEYRYLSPGFTLGLGSCRNCMRVGAFLHAAASVTATEDIEPWQDELAELRSYHRRMLAAWDAFMEVVTEILESAGRTCALCNRIVHNFHSKHTLMTPRPLPGELGEFGEFEALDELWLG